MQSKEVMNELNEKIAIRNRYEFIILFDVKNGNPNGDPDSANQPRIDIDTNHGLVTDVCIKRKIRDFILARHAAEDGFDIYVNRDETLNAKDQKAISSAKEANIDKEKEEEYVIDFMCKRYFDIRTFGGVMTSFTKKETKMSGNAGQLTGPVQITFAESADPIYPQNVTITRCAITTEKDAEDKKNAMGNKWIVPYGLYRADGYISANLAQKTNFSEADLEVLWDAIMNMFDEDHAAGRGKMVTRKLIIFKHDSCYGNAPSHKLLESVVVEKKEGVENPRSFSDYNITIPTEESLPEGVHIEVRD